MPVAQVAPQKTVGALRRPDERVQDRWLPEGSNPGVARRRGASSFTVGSVVSSDRKGETAANQAWWLDANPVTSSRSSPKGLLSGEGAVDIERDALAQDGVAGPLQLVRHLLGGDRGVLLRFLALVVTLDFGVVPDGEMRRLDECPG